ncbi:MAG: SRPBCC domain-containing protein, partial [Halobacteriales archaeon]|nr:SRPBCC domain-containing protein [Halobacteriales archaeon]
MDDYAIRARLNAGCSPGDVMKWLTSPEGIAGWWTDSVTGSASAEGDTFQATFPTTDVVFELVVNEVTDSSVAWHVPDSPAWWKGTTIRFELGEADGGGTSLLFTHDGFDPEDPGAPRRP